LEPGLSAADRLHRRHAEVKRIFTATTVLILLMATTRAWPQASAPAITSLSPATLSYSSAALPVGFTVTGAGFVSGSQIVFNGTALKTSFRSATQLSASLKLTPAPGNVALIAVKNPGGAASAPYEVTLAVNGPKVTYPAAFRFLEQATWGPAGQDLINLQQQGFQPWLTAQQAAKESKFPSPPASAAKDFAQSTFMYNAINGPDQLRQRVSFALGQIMVISEDKIPLAGMMPYLQLLQDNAFGNYLTLLQAVTLSPSMGHYLDMVDSSKPNAVKGTLPNENYAREFMQLFTIGTIELNQDGTPMLDSQGDTIPLYGESDIQNLARVFTGWTFPPTPGAAAKKLVNPENYVGQMVPVEAIHDTDPKTFLGQTLPGGQTAEKDLSQALGVVFNHPNVAPFVSIRLIQHLVTSNPSPAYVKRIAAVFANNGAGKRGDLWAVTKAILTDPEARQGDTAANAAATGGHLREPVLYATAMLRALGSSVSSTNQLAEKIAIMGQTLLVPPSVFNYYSPFYRIPGGAAAGPEFQLFSTGTALLRADFVAEVLLSKLGAGTTVNPTPFVQLAADPGALMDAVNNAFMGGQMPSAMRSTIMTAMAAASDPGTIAYDAVYLTASSGLFQVEQ
jgi:uncharacterized protein (DUF1800 family)